VEDDPPDLTKVKEACSVLIEHFDAVQIFATRKDGEGQEGTVNVQWGAGNYFARFGHVKVWLLKEEGCAHRAYSSDE